MTDSLKASTIILIRIKNQLLNAKEGVNFLVDQKASEYESGWNNQKVSKIDTAMYGLIHYSFMWYASFIDEYNNFFFSTDEMEQTKVKNIKGRTQKYISNIKDVFGDVKLARNRVLAHGYRNGKVPLSNDEINSYHNQLTRFENLEPFTLLSNMTSLIIDEIQKEFVVINEDEIGLQ